MEIIQIPVGSMGNLSYIAYSKSDSEEGRNAVLIDPAWEPERLSGTIRQLGLNLRAVLLTHGHFDHSNAVPAIIKEFPGTAVYMQKEDADLPTEKFMFRPLGEGYSVQEMPQISVIPAPGHTGGSVCFMLHGENNALFTGDTLFAGACGRIDFPESLPDRMHGTLRNISRLPAGITVYPGHSYNASCTTLEQEIRANPYMRAAMDLNKDEFLEMMMH